MAKHVRHSRQHIFQRFPACIERWQRFTCFCNLHAWRLEDYGTYEAASGKIECQQLIPDRAYSFVMLLSKFPGNSFLLAENSDEAQDNLSIFR